jgi:hypothetical protein
MSETIRSRMVGAFGSSLAMGVIGLFAKKRSASRKGGCRGKGRRLKHKPRSQGRQPKTAERFEGRTMRWSGPKLSRATINCRSTGPDKHVVLVINFKVIAYRSSGVATLDGASDQMRTARISDYR